MAPGGGLGIVYCDGARTSWQSPCEDQMLVCYRMLANFFHGNLFTAVQLHCELRKRHPAIGNSRARCKLPLAAPALLAVARDTCDHQSAFPRSLEADATR